MSLKIFLSHAWSDKKLAAFKAIEARLRGAGHKVWVDKRGIEFGEEITPKLDATIANLGSLQEAQCLKLMLESAGIEAFIPDEFSAGMAPFLTETRSGIRLQVPEKDEEEATAFIARLSPAAVPVGSPPANLSTFASP